MDILTYLQGQGCHSIDVLLTIFHITQAKQKARQNDDVCVRWKEIRDELASQGKTISDGTYRARRDELVAMQLLKLQRLDCMRADIKMTEKGMKIASIVDEFTEELKTVAKEK